MERTRKTAYSYSEIAEAIGEDVRSGKYAAGEPCPSLTQLMRKYRVSRVTAARAVDELKRKGFVASRPGRGTFVTRQARMLGGTLGFIVPGLCYAEIFPPICRTLSELAREKGLNLIVGDASSDDPAARADQAVRLARKFADERVLGVFFQPVEFVRESERINREILAIFDAAQIPVVLMDSDVVPSPERSGYDLVGINHFDAGRALARHLVERGVRRIAFVKKPYCDSSVQNRFEGVRSVMTLCGGSAVALALDTKSPAAVKRALARKVRPEAVVCRNDHQAAHLMVTLRKLGLRVPEDVLVAGFNDIAYASVLEPGLTTVRIPCEGIARTAFEFLIARIAEPSEMSRECYLSAPLVVRGSTCRILPRKTRKKEKVT